MPERIQLSRKKGWRKPENVISVSRPGRWGNPFPVADFGLDLSLRLFSDAARGFWNPKLLDHLTDDEYMVVAAKRDAWAKRIGGHPTDIARSELKGHDLACWCPPDQPCHADTLLALANR